MKQRHRLFEVIVATPGGAVTKEVWAETPQLACGVAEASAPVGRAMRFSMSADIVGRCRKCQSFIESGERHQSVRLELVCVDCI